MSTPPEEITITCPDCGHVYKDWYRASINLALDDFGANYLEQASTTTCPVCRVTHDLGTLVVRPRQRWEHDLRDVTDGISCNDVRRVTGATGIVPRIVTGPHDANRQDSLLSMRYDTGRSSSVIRLRSSQPKPNSRSAPALSNGTH